MTKKIKSIFLLGTLISLVGCSTNERSDVLKSIIINNSVPPVTNSAVKLLKGKIDTLNTPYTSYEEYLPFYNKMKSFSSKLSDELVWDYAEEGKNFAFSPYSIELCLGLAARCANGSTRKEILDAMGVDYQTLNTYYHRFFEDGEFVHKTNTGDVDSISAPANSIWLSKQLKAKNDCLEALSKDYYCDSYSVDFMGKTAKANEAIEEYIYRNTRGLINPDLDLSKETLFVLLNTLYIKDVWNDYGHELGYADGSYKFKNSNGQYSSKQLLHGHSQSGRAYYGEDYSSFRTSTNNSFSITFIKPNEGKKLKDVFNETTINETLARRYETSNEEKKERYYTSCIFPEFKAGSDFSLNHVFKKYGISSLSDFTSITEEPTVIDESRHMASLDVNKKGIEGAAVTYMAMPGAAAPDDWKDVYEEYVVDKEFGFILTGGPGVLFSGVVTNID